VSNETTDVLLDRADLASRCWRTWAMSSASVRSARENARRRSARSRQAWSACNQAPRPGRARRVSTTAWGCPVPSV